MYKAYIDDVCILDPSKNILIEDPVVELADNSAGSFSFTIYTDNPGYDRIKTLKSICTVYQDDELVFKGRVIAHGKGQYNQKTVECEGELAYLADSIQPPGKHDNLTVRGYLEDLINTHNSQVEAEKRFELGAVTLSNMDYSLRYTNDNSTLQEIKDDLIENLGGHLRIRYENGKRYLDYLEDYPRVCTQSIEFGENLLTYSENISAYDLATVCIPLGAKLEDGGEISELEQRLDISEVNGGNRAIEIPAAVNVYGRIAKVVTFDDVHTASNLKAKGEAWLKDNQYEDLELTLTAVDLADFGIESDHLRLLDRIRCTSKPHGMDREFPLLEMKINLLDPEANEYTLGSKTKLFTGSTSKAQAKYEAFVKNQTSTSHVLQQALDNAMSMLNAFAHSGYVYITENEIFILDYPVQNEADLDQAKNVWRWNMGGLAFSKSGYKGPYEVAITMDGTIAGQFIAAGTIGADKISVSYTQTEEKKWQDTLENGYWGISETRTQIQNSANSVLISAEEKFTSALTSYYTKAQVDTSINGVLISAEASIKSQLGSYYTKAQIDVKTDSIEASVSSKVGANEIISKINMSPESIKISSNKFDVDAKTIRLSATQLAWTSTYSSMTENGTLTAQNATLRGTMTCGSESGYWMRMNASGQVEGGYGSTTYGYMAFSAAIRSVDTGITRRGLLISGGTMQIHTETISVSDSSDTSVTAIRGFTGQCAVLYSVASGTFDWSDLRSNTLRFINGICVQAPNA